MTACESDVEKDSRTYEDNGNFKENKINFSKEVKQVIDKVIDSHILRHLYYVNIFLLSERF